MFQSEILTEILETIRKNKLRTALTGFAVAWGIFIFVVLLGMGNGVKNAINSNFSDDAKNKIEVSDGRTSIEYKGLKKGRRINLYNEDAEILKDYFTEVKDKNTTFWFGSKEVSYKDKKGGYPMNGVSAERFKSMQVKLLQGRTLNGMDILRQRKVVVIGKTPYEELFGENGRAEGQYMNINGTSFLIVGVIEQKRSWQNNRMYMPITTAQKMFNSGSSRVHEIALTVDADLSLSQKLEKKIRHFFSRKYEFSPEDKRAIYIDNNLEDYENAQVVIVGIKLFVMVIGILTLISGITGISNIMLISVKERTKEIGIRKALGARPNSIIKQIVMESILITSLAGYIGLVLGAMLVELVNFLMKNSDNDAFKDPTVDLQTALIATLILIVAGALAGWLPARKAAKIKPIEALRYE